eukprot:s3000_g8.t1
MAPRVQVRDVSEMKVEDGSAAADLNLVNYWTCAGETTSEKLMKLITKRSDIRDNEIVLSFEPMIAYKYVVVDRLCDQASDRKGIILRSPFDSSPVELRYLVLMYQKKVIKRINPETTLADLLTCKKKDLGSCLAHGKKDSWDAKPADGKEKPVLGEEAEAVSALDSSANLHGSNSRVDDKSETGD